MRIRRPEAVRGPDARGRKVGTGFLFDATALGRPNEGKGYQGTPAIL